MPGVGAFTITDDPTWLDIQPQDIIDHYISDQEFDPPVDPACLTLGTLVTTKNVEQSVEYLRFGDLVLTKDHGYQTIRRIGQRTLPARSRMAPICIGKGVFGNSRDLLVSPCHRMLLPNRVLLAVFGNSEMLIAARDLLGHDQVYQKTGGLVTYFHKAFDQHQIIYAENAPTESLQPFKNDAMRFGRGSFDELLEIFPELERHESPIKAARKTFDPIEANLIFRSCPAND